MERKDALKIMEAAFFIADQPVSLKAVYKLFDGDFPMEELQLMAQEIAQAYQSSESALEVREVAGGWQFSSRHDFGPWIRKLFKDRLTYRLSNSAMETLSIVAYKQPITRNEIEEIRGVEVTAVLDTLVDRKLLKIIGRKETLGRPLLYGTTPDFLRAFGLKKLEELPSIESLVPPETLPESEGELAIDHQQLELGDPIPAMSAATLESAESKGVSESEEVVLNENATVEAISKE